MRASDRCPRGTEDEVWLTEAGRNAWIVLTRDKRIRYRQNERAALTSARVRAFVFTGGNVSIKETAAILVTALPKLSRIAASDPGPYIYHIGRSGKPRKMD